MGEGGFGTVYLARQDKPVRREVALKVIKPGMNSREVISRFQAERQALALMDHEGIARVLQTGETQDGRPWFAMEYVRGLPIQEFCDRRQLPLRDRLALFARVCDAVQHAHHRGVIHRDLKPGNILVTTDEDDRPVPKVIDFGIAKALHAPLTPNSFTTGVGQFIGTPEYMSPEQADGSSLGIDTRSDVYALGIVLFELLAGQLPFERETASPRDCAELIQAIQEDEPLRPSTMVARASDSMSRSIADDRRMRPSQLVSVLRRDLDWIPLMAIRKQRSDRYMSAESLGRDVRRWLDGRPLEAGPRRMSYRLRLFIRRRRRSLSAATVLLAGLVGTAAMAWEARDAGVEAALRTQESHQLKAFIEDSMKDMNRGHLRATLDEALAKAGFTTEGDGQFTVDQDRVIDAPTIATLVHQSLSQDLMESTLENIRTHMAGQPVLRARLQLAAIKRAMELMLVSDVQPGLASAMMDDMRSAVRVTQEALGADHLDTFHAHRIAGGLFLKLQRPRDAERLLRTALDGYERTLGRSHRYTTGSLHRLAKALGNQDRFDDASSLLEDLARRALEMDGSTLSRGTYLMAQSDLANIMSRRGRPHEAVAILEDVIDRQIALHGEDHLHVHLSRANLARYLWYADQPEAARAMAERSMTALRRIVGDSHRSTLFARDTREMTLASTQPRSLESSSVGRPALESSPGPAADRGR
ncbi:MAG: serine/threonine-protein kinase [Phycisphaerales bacterium]|nr:serine/threonine-protein kinase [Phycisphaerales bacterium]